MISHQTDNNETRPFDLRLFSAGLLCGALFVLPAFLFMCDQCVRHGQAEVRLRAQLKAEHRFRKP